MFNKILLEGLGDPYAAPNKKTAPTSTSAPDPGAAPPPGQTVAQMQADTSRRNALDALRNQDTQNTKSFVDTVKDKASGAYDTVKEKASEYGGQVADFATKHSDALMGAGVGAAAAGLGYLAYKKMKAAKEARA